MVCPLNAAFNRAAAYASLDQPRLMRPSHAVGSCFRSERGALAPSNASDWSFAAVDRQVIS